LALRAGIATLPVDQVYTMFSPYCTDKGAKVKLDINFRHRFEAVTAVLGRRTHGAWYHMPTLPGPVDPRWLDRALEIGEVNMVSALGRPGHAATEQFLSQRYEAILQKKSLSEDAYDVLGAMVHLRHPDATSALVRALEQELGKKGSYHAWYLARFVSDLPKSAVPAIEALLPRMEDNQAAIFLTHLETLRTKP
jgi:hypothetical protein